MSDCFNVLKVWWCLICFMWLLIYVLFMSYLLYERLVGLSLRLMEIIVLGFFILVNLSFVLMMWWFLLGVLIVWFGLRVLILNYYLIYMCWSWILSWVLIVYVLYFFGEDLGLFGSYCWVSDCFMILMSVWDWVYWKVGYRDVICW